MEHLRSDSFALLRKQAEEVDNITADVESGNDECRRTMDSFYEVLFARLYPYSKDYAGTPLPPPRWSDSYIYIRARAAAMECGRSIDISNECNRELRPLIL